MKATFVSTATLWNSPRSSLDRLQSDLVKANKELSTGRAADVGLKLGRSTGQAISLRQERSELDALIDSNASVKLRLDTSAKSLARIRQLADGFRDAMIATPHTGRSMATLEAQARSNLNSLVSDLNNDAAGQYVFGGINSKQKPIADYGGTPPSAAKAAVDAAFLSSFGFTQADPAVSTIAPAAMQAFLDGPFANLFSSASWQANWSSASNQNVQSLISATDKIDTSVNANEKAARDLAMAYTMSFDLGMSGLSDATREILASKVVQTLSRASTGLSDLEARLGIAQESVDAANNRMTLQKSIFDEQIGHLENVDPAEAKIRVDQISTQIQMSFSLTSQLRNLSLINYL